MAARVAVTAVRPVAVPRAVYLAVAVVAHAALLWALAIRPGVSEPALPATIELALDAVPVPPGRDVPQGADTPAPALVPAPPAAAPLAEPQPVAVPVVPPSPQSVAVAAPAVPPPLQRAAVAAPSDAAVAALPVPARPLPRPAAIVRPRAMASASPARAATQVPARPATQAASPGETTRAAEAAPSAQAVAAPVSAGDPNAVRAWQGRLAGLLQRAKRDPGAGVAGVAIVSFSVDREGRVVSVRLVRSAGSAVLDEEAVALVYRAQPLPPPPPERAGNTVSLTVPVRFSLE